MHYIINDDDDDLRKEFFSKYVVSEPNQVYLPTKSQHGSLVPPKLPIDTNYPSQMDTSIFYMYLVPPKLSIDTNYPSQMDTLSSNLHICTKTLVEGMSS